MKTNKTITISVIFLTCLMFNTNSALSQESKSFLENVNRNAFYGNAGVGFWSNSFKQPIAEYFFFQAFYYERIIKQKIGEKNSSSFVRIGFGRHNDVDYHEKYVIAHYGFLTGAKTHHFEMGFGLRFLTKSTYHNYLPISFNAGWRFQKPNRHLIFRIGTGYPEVMYFGIGWSF